MAPPATDPETLIAACFAMLTRRRYSTCRTFALRLPTSHPAREQIITVVDVLSAEDHYSVLQVRSDADHDLARRQFRKLALLLDPNTNTFPYSNEAFERIREAWHVLSDRERRDLYDREIGVSIPREPRELGGTFWTACPYCWNLYEYEERYKDCALLCHGCRKAFHAEVVKPPVKQENAVLEGEKRQSYWCHASLPMKYYDPSEVTEKEDKNLGEQEQNFVYVSDCDDGGSGGDEFGENVKGDVGNVGDEGVGRVGGFQGNGQRMTRIKTVANKGVGGRREVCVDADDRDMDLDWEDSDGELEFTEGEGDVFVGIRSSK